MRRVTWRLLAAPLLVLPVAAPAQTYPNKPIQ